MKPVLGHRTKEEHMKYLKIFGLAAIAAASLMALSAGTASADENTSPAGTTAKEDVWSLVPGTSAKLVNTSGGEILSCTKANETFLIASQGPGKPILGTTKYDLENCTLPAKELKEGGEEINAPAESMTATVKATSESQLTINTGLFGSCVYAVTAGTTIGTINTSSGEFVENEVTEKLSGSGAVCPETTKWIAEWVRTLPNPFIYDNN
jgi:hypothetical protein